METSAGSTEGNIELQSKRKGNECLTCGARARSVGTREVIGRGSDVGRRDESARERGGAVGAGRGVDELQRAGRVAVNTVKAGGGVLGRFRAVWAGSERSGSALGRSGLFWAGSGGLDRSGPESAWGGLDRPGWGPIWAATAGQGRSGPVR